MTYLSDFVNIMLSYQLARGATVKGNVPSLHFCFIFKDLITWGLPSELVERLG